MDKYEVTVGRFRKFVDQYNGTAPTDGSVAQPFISNSGWQSIISGLIIIINAIYPGQTGQAGHALVGGYLPEENRASPMTGNGSFSTA